MTARRADQQTLANPAPPITVSTIYHLVNFYFADPLCGKDGPSRSWCGTPPIDRSWIVPLLVWNDP
jgi:hypothetical protein